MRIFPRYKEKLKKKSFDYSNTNFMPEVNKTLDINCQKTLIWSYFFVSISMWNDTTEEKKTKIIRKNNKEKKTHEKNKVR